MSGMTLRCTRTRLSRMRAAHSSSLASITVEGESCAARSTGMKSGGFKSKESSTSAICSMRLGVEFQIELEKNGDEFRIFFTDLSRRSVSALLYLAPPVVDANA